MGYRKYLVWVAPQADQRFASHLAFLARVSERAAFGLYDAYQGALEFLADNPESCPRYAPKATLRAKLFGKRYRIVFEIADNTVHIYDIQDCRQSTDKNLVQ